MKQVASVPDRARRLLGRGRPVVAVASVTYVGLALSVLSAPMLATALGASGRGQLAAAFAVIQVLGFVAFLGLPRGVAVQDHREAAASRGAVTLIGVIGLLSASACFLAADQLAGGDPWVAGAIRLSSVVLALAGLYQIGVERLLLTSQLATYNLSRICNVVLPSLGYIVAFLAGALTLELAFAITLTGQLLASIVGVVSSIGVLRRSAGKRPPWRFSLSMWSSTVVDGVAWRMDQVLLAMLATSATLGVYAVASTIASASGGLTQALNAVLYGRFAATADDGHAGGAGDGTAGDGTGGRGGTSAMRRSRAVALLSSVLASAAMITAMALWHEALLGPTFDGLMTPLIVLCIAQALNDQWQLQVYRQSADQASVGLTAPSWIGLAAFALVAAVVAALDRLDADTMALAVLAGAVVRIALRLLVTARHRRAAVPNATVG
ncbi:oligosaccharide flippase family protein [Agrococcus beijingensis]|uniref:oligosaccharide flippase family protein n=1 Tax=Agrococcus beijingensis TaxID=3068634 RepID=UPI0027413483|nr:oligosaccharide flippase family protein [Agrococcus sp. REN33]